MAVSVHIVLLIIALVLLALAALGVPARRYDLLAAGLFFWVASSAVPG